MILTLVLMNRSSISSFLNVFCVMLFLLFVESITQRVLLYGEVGAPFNLGTIIGVLLQRKNIA